jgi:hypothetical protein
VRTKLPEVSCSALQQDGWSQRALLAFGGLAPKKDGHDRRDDYDRLDRRDVQRVARRVVAHCGKEGVRPTSTVVTPPAPLAVRLIPARRVAFRAPRLCRPAPRGKIAVLFPGGSAAGFAMPDAELVG